MYCKKCKYSFEAEKTPLRCPLCGEEGVEKEKSVEELVEEL